MLTKYSIRYIMGHNTKHCVRFIWNVIEIREA